MVIGITGGVGCGKSTILDILRNEYGANIIMADDVAKELQLPGMPVFNDVVQNFGQDIISVDGNIDRKKLASIVFADEKKLQMLNELIHPAVKQEISRKIAEYKAADANALIIVEAALLLEAGYRDILDEIWAIIVSYEERVKRLFESRGYTREKTDSIIASQKSDEEFIDETDFYIENSGTLDETRNQIDMKMASLGINKKS